MGQYHITVNLDKREYIYPHHIGLGLKQAEQIGGFDATMGDIIFLLLSISNDRGGGDVKPTEDIKHLLGRWAGDRVLVVGDYSEEYDVDLPDFSANELYSLAKKEFTDISPEINKMIRILWGMAVDGGAWQRRETVDYDTYLGPWDKPETEAEVG